MYVRGGFALAFLHAVGSKSIGGHSGTEVKCGTVHEVFGSASVGRSETHAVHGVGRRQCACRNLGARCGSGVVDAYSSGSVGGGSGSGGAKGRREKYSEFGNIDVGGGYKTSQRTLDIAKMEYESNTKQKNVPDWMAKEHYLSAIKNRGGENPQKWVENLRIRRKLTIFTARTE